TGRKKRCSHTSWSAPTTSSKPRLSMTKCLARSAFRRDVSTVTGYFIEHRPACLQFRCRSMASRQPMPMAVPLASPPPRLNRPRPGTMPASPPAASRSRINPASAKAPPAKSISLICAISTATRFARCIASADAASRVLARAPMREPASRAALVPRSITTDLERRCHVRVEAAEISDIACLLHHQRRRLVCGDTHVKSLIARCRGVHECVLIDPFDGVANLGAHLGGRKYQVLDRHLDCCGLRHLRPQQSCDRKEERRLQATPHDLTYLLNSAATCSACCSCPWKIFKPVCRRLFSSALFADGISVVSSALSTALW